MHSKFQFWYYSLFTATCSRAPLLVIGVPLVKFVLSLSLSIELGAGYINFACSGSCTSKSIEIRAYLRDGSATAQCNIFAEFIFFVIGDFCLSENVTHLVNCGQVGRHYTPHENVRSTAVFVNGDLKISYIYDIFAFIQFCKAHTIIRLLSNLF